MMEGMEQATDNDAASECPIVRPSVYIDTSIPSYLTSRPSREWPLKRYQWVTCLFWNAHGARFEMHVSRFVVDEVKAGDPDAAQKRVEAISSLPRLEIPDDVDRLTALILKKTGLPNSAKADAEHVAIAATHKIEFLATWNCKHLANPAITPKVARACERAGFRSPAICTPEVILRHVVYGPQPCQRPAREQSCRARLAAQAISVRMVRAVR
jgi:predicted nucleic acid-binding protein